MALRCSLLGHDFGETEVDREREERGSEVVVTVTEYQRCDRCGEKTITSENTEVTALGTGGIGPTPDESAPEESPSATADGTATTSGETGAPVEPGGTDAADADGDAENVEDDEPTGEDDLEIPTDENGDPITDDAEILTDEPTEDTDRDHGEWPDSDDVGPPLGTENEPTAWPEDEDGESTGVETTYAEESSTATADSSASGNERGARDGNKREHESEAATDDAVFVDAEPTSEQSESYTGIASAQSAPDPSQSTTQEGANTEFFCPQCSFVAPGDRGSLRAGDICPECRKGYLGERNR